MAVKTKSSPMIAKLCIDKPPKMAIRQVTITKEENDDAGPPKSPYRRSSLQQADLAKSTLPIRENGFQHSDDEGEFYCDDTIISGLSSDDLSGDISMLEKERWALSSNDRLLTRVLQNKLFDVDGLERWSSHGDEAPKKVAKRASKINIDIKLDDLCLDLPCSKMDRIPSVVTFGDVRVRSYERILDVHPATSSGPSLGLGWRYVDEKCTPNIVCDKKRSSDFRLSRSEREYILREELGYSNRDLARAVRTTLKLKQQRRQTVNNLSVCHNIIPIEKVENAMEKVSKKIKNGVNKIGRSLSPKRNNKSRKVCKNGITRSLSPKRK